MRRLRNLASTAVCACICLSGANPTPAVADEDHASTLADFPKLSAETDWPWWRGPSRNGIAAPGQKVPVRFDDMTNVRWRAAVPGRGHSSPVLVGNRAYLTTADVRQQVHSLLAYDRESGALLFARELDSGGFPQKSHPKNSEATPTLASDGERLFAVFFDHDAVQVFARDLQGNPLWQKTVQPFRPQKYEWGYAPSLLLYRNLVIIAAELDNPDSALTALDRTTGTPVWRVQRPNNISYATPVVAHLGGRDQLLLSGADQLASYDPLTGKAHWTTNATTLATCGTAVWDGERIFVSGGYPQPGTFAVTADGHVAWSNSTKCYELSLLALDGLVYGINEAGILICWGCEDGRERWRHRLGAPVSSSAVFAGGHIYWGDERGTWHVFRPSSKGYELVAQNRLGDEILASPAIVGGRIYLRVASSVGGDRKEWLYCIEEKR